MKKILYTILAVIAFSSCTQVIDIDLNQASPQYVIEGEITDASKNAIIKISKTVNFDESNNFPTVSGATVTISDDAGNAETLTEKSAGIYEAKTIKGVPGRTYTLTVKHDGNTFTSVSKMPANTPLLNINTIETNGFGGGPNGDTATTYVAVPLYKDPAGIKNYYHFIQTVNGETSKSILVRNDNLTDGKQSVQPLFTFDSTINRDDTVHLLMQCIDNHVYDYFYSLDQVSGNGPGGGTTPSNPVNNISGGALGYFSACSVSEFSIIVK